MTRRETIINNYIEGYNQFDVDKMVEDFDEAVQFENISNGEMRVIAHFFDFIFYRTYSFYKSNGESDIPGVYALCVITLFPLLNLSSLIFIFIDIFNIRDWDYSKPILVGCFLLVMSANYYRIYKWVGLGNLIRTWEKANANRKKRLTKCMVIYLIISIIFLFAGIIY